MKPLECDPRNPPGDFYALAGICLACGMPEREAPDLLADLKLTDGDTYFIKQPQTEQEIKRACAAISVCCVAALRYSGKNPDIIRSFGEWTKNVCDYLVDEGGNIIENPDRPNFAAQPNSASSSTVEEIKENWLMPIPNNKRD